MVAASDVCYQTLKSHEVREVLCGSSLLVRPTKIFHRLGEAVLDQVIDEIIKHQLSSTIISMVVDSY